MLNHSIAQLRQIKILNICPQVNKAQHSSARLNSSSAKPLKNPRSNDDEFSIERPSPLRRRSTRNNLVGEQSASRLQRLDAAISKRTYETFVVLYDARETIYISEQQCGQSPVYDPFKVDSRQKMLEMAVYSKARHEKWSLLLRVDIPLNHMVARDDDDSSDDDNSVYLQFEDELWYSLPTIKENEEKKPQVNARAESYNYNQVMRLQNSTEFINDALLSISKLKKEMSELLQQADARIQRIRNLSILQDRISEVKNVSKALQKSSKSDRAKITKLRETCALRRSLLSTSRAHKTSVMNDLQESKNKQEERLPAFDLLSSEIRRLQRQVTTTLSHIYPIIITPTGSRIRGLRTAQNSDYWMQNHEKAAALGHIAHLVSLLSQYLDIPLRYPVRPISSHSYIFDPISLMPESSDVHGGPPYSLKKDYRFPLFFERGGVERLQWGVFLLNKDIEQLLQGRGLVCGDLRHSLQNLDGLVVWLVSVTEDEDKSLVPSRAPVRSENAALMSRVSNQDQSQSETVGAVEITDHEDLLAAQLRTRIKGKTRLPQLTEKDEHEDEIKTDMSSGAATIVPP
ncbi:putative UV radiation resistance protein [Taphrina deformans PYCC 5710]|uniref:Autophagy-related protein 14 n=1 Tax=Taphrina deformans (strain PYCC 5710 / ATCC 11124 / CBS 356.35 / IMI 108563 / JCM 9778 / NBRC 8474) TaxID=1097556 RepID=R4X734_TAPDE|nr:putative UV radiation resistance protein [Taphrina deformans PYCC 5710]|eukprot:CCG81082.1 putative UV radiation resistance protein [Taphrina deformans PYCC 5710]